MNMVSVVKASTVWSCFLKAGGRATLRWTIPANPGAIIHTKVLSVSARKVIRVAWKGETWRWCGHAAISVEISKPGTKMRGNECLEKHPCPHLKRACCWMIPIGESSHGSDRCHPRKTKKRLRCPGGFRQWSCPVLGLCARGKSKLSSTSVWHC